jgi:uncharacterized protein YhfF
MTLASADESAVARMWRSYTEAAGTDAELAGSFAFGDSAELADKLAELVRHGPKRATAGLLLDCELGGGPMPRAGDLSVVLDGSGQPVCVIRTTDVRVRPLREADEAFAWDEGEGDRTLAWWRRAHDAYFSRRCEALGVAFSEELDVVFERFEVVWPVDEWPRS